MFAGGDDGKGLLAYRADTGGPAWSAPTGHGSYSSPHLAWLGGQPQILSLNDDGLIAVEPTTGNVMWKHPSPMPGAPLSLQPHPLRDREVLVTSVAEFGLAMLDLVHEGDAWKVEKRWASGSIHPSFNDFVVHKGAAFGFDEAIFACIDVETGKRLWKKGRYGHGQVLLLADQELLLILAESGEAVLLAANPEKHDELCRFQVIEGKTWNHPALAHGRLYVRNAEEIACYELAPP